MFIKQNTVLPPGTKITKCPPMAAAGKSVYRLELEEEARLIAAAQVPTKDTHTCKTPGMEGKLCFDCETSGSEAALNTLRTNGILDAA